MHNKMLLIGVIGIIVGVLLSTTVALAGSLNPNGGPGAPAAQMYTLEQIYQRLTTGAFFTKQSGFTEPGSGPGTGTMHTLHGIMAAARALAQRVAKTVQTQCWDSDGAVISCAGTGQDGDYKAGIDPVVPAIFGTVGAGDMITLAGTLSNSVALRGTQITNTAIITATGDINTGNNLAAAVLAVTTIPAPEKLYLPVIMQVNPVNLESTHAPDFPAQDIDGDGISDSQEAEPEPNDLGDSDLDPPPALKPDEEPVWTNQMFLPLVDR